MQLTCGDLRWMRRGRWWTSGRWISSAGADEGVPRSLAREPFAVEYQTVWAHELTSQTTVAAVVDAAAFFDVVAIAFASAVEVDG